MRYHNNASFIYLFYQFFFIFNFFVCSTLFIFFLILTCIVLAITILASIFTSFHSSFVYLTHKISPLHYYCYLWFLLHSTIPSTHENDRVPVKYWKNKKINWDDDINCVGYESSLIRALGLFGWSRTVIGDCIFWVRVHFWGAIVNFWGYVTAFRKYCVFLRLCNRT
jgi:hypothetical protein